MASQAETINFIKSNFKCDDLGDNVLKVLVSWNDGRSQLVFATVGTEIMQVASPFAQLSDISAEQALNANQSAFGVGKVADWFAIQHVVPMADLDASEISIAFNSIGEIADELEKKLGLGDKL